MQKASTQVLSRYIHPTQEHQDDAMKLYESKLLKDVIHRA